MSDEKVVPTFTFTETYKGTDINSLYMQNQKRITKDQALNFKMSFNYDYMYERILYSTVDFVIDRFKNIGVFLPKDKEYPNLRDVTILILHKAINFIIRNMPNNRNMPNKRTYYNSYYSLKLADLSLSLLTLDKFGEETDNIYIKSLPDNTNSNLIPLSNYSNKFDSSDLLVTVLSALFCHSNINPFKNFEDNTFNAINNLNMFFNKEVANYTPISSIFDLVEDIFNNVEKIIIENKSTLENYKTTWPHEPTNIISKVIRDAEMLSLPYEFSEKTIRTYSTMFCYDFRLSPDQLKDLRFSEINFFLFSIENKVKFNKDFYNNVIQAWIDMQPYTQAGLILKEEYNDKIEQRYHPSDLSFKAFENTIY